MQLLLIGVNHRTAPVTLRERLAVPSCQAPAALQHLRMGCASNEIVILSTCNRIEYYLTTSDPSAAVRQLIQAFSHRSGLPAEVVESHLYRMTGPEAVRHLFRVATGLDSMIVGESEIIAQVKQAYLLAQSQGATGALLNRLFQKALHSAKLIRTQTRIAEGHGSIGSVVVTLARQLFHDTLAQRDVLLWGAGKAGEATARHLVKHGLRQLWIVNRTQPKAQELAALCRGGWLSWEQALTHLAHVDIAIVCTQAPHFVVNQDDAPQFLPQRNGRPLCLIDLAVPRNVDPALKGRAGLTLYNIDDLQTIAQQGLAARQQEVARCEGLIQRQVELFHRPASRRIQKETVPC